MKSDLQIQKDVMAELKWEPLLHANEIGVAVKDGVVTLSGIVDTYGKKISAEKATKRISGVKAVALDIQVGDSPAFRKTDMEIAMLVTQALHLHTAVQEEKIKVKVDEGFVTLEGTVEWEYQRRAAVNAVENLPGVKNVFNLIVLSPKTPATADIQRKISAAFHRRASLDAESILVESEGSKIILRGSVSSMKEKEDAAEAAWSAPGVTAVDNRLLVESLALVL